MYLILREAPSTGKVRQDVPRDHGYKISVPAAMREFKRRGTTYADPA
jgi:hypothetical protein